MEEVTLESQFDAGTSLVKGNTLEPPPLRSGTSWYHLDRDDQDDASRKLEKSCCAKGTFGSRLWSRIKLDHVVVDNAPFFILLKILLCTLIALLLDEGTRNPDSITSTFVGYLGLAPYMHLSKDYAVDTLTSGLLGAVIGTLVNAACFGPDSRWMQLLSVPLSILLTVYILFFFGKTRITSLSSGVFSSLFVVFVQFAYPPIDPFVPQDDPRRLIWQTLLVRVLALVTGVFSATVTNLLISATAPLEVYKTNSFFTERLVWRTQKRRWSNLADFNVQSNFERVVNLIFLSVPLSRAAQTWVFSSAVKKEVALIGSRASVLFRLLTFRSFLEQFVETGRGEHALPDEEINGVERLIELSIRNAAGESPRQLTVEQEIEEIQALPDYLHIEKTVLIRILLDLRQTKVTYRGSDKISPFFGKV